MAKLIKLIGRENEYAETFRVEGIGRGDKYTTRIHTSPVNYQYGKKFRKIDTSIKQMGNVFGMTDAHYHAELPLKANGWMSFYLGKKNIRVRAKDAQPVDGILIEESNYGWDSKKIEYPGAFGAGTCLIITLGNEKIKKEVRIDKVLRQDLVIDFEIEGSYEDHLLPMRVWGNSIDLEIGDFDEMKAKSLKNGFLTLGSRYNPANSYNVHPGRLEIGGNKKQMIVRKVIDKRLFDVEGLEPPIYTDITLTVLAGSGSTTDQHTRCYTNYDDSGNFSNKRTHNSCFVCNKQDELWVWVNPRPDIGRSYFPLNAANLPSTGIRIDAARLLAYCIQRTLHDNDAYAYLQLQEASAGDGYICTPVNSPKNYGQKTITSMSTSTWQTFTLNSTFIGDIVPGAWNYFCMREGHDIVNNTPGAINDVRFRGDGYTGTNFDPYYEIDFTWLIQKGGMF